MTLAKDSYQPLDALRLHVSEFPRHRSLEYTCDKSADSAPNSPKFDQSQSLVQIHLLEVVAYPKCLSLRIVKAASIGAGYRLGENAPIDQRLVVFRTRTYVLSRIIWTATNVNTQT